MPEGIWIRLQTFGRKFYGLMKLNWSSLDTWTSSMSGVRKARLMTRRIPHHGASMEVGQ